MEGKGGTHCAGFGRRPNHHLPRPTRLHQHALLHNPPTKIPLRVSRLVAGVWVQWGLVHPEVTTETPLAHSYRKKNCVHIRYGRAGGGS